MDTVINLKKLLFTILYIAIALLGSCKFENYVTIYYSDLLEFLGDSSKALMLLPIKINLESGGSESCENEKAKVKNAIDDYFLELADAACIQNDMTTYMVFEGKIPLVKNEKSLEEQSYLVALSISSVAKKIEVKMHLSHDAFQSINNYTRKEFWTSFESKDLSVEIDLQNDKSEKINVNCRSCFLNATPRPFSGTVSLEKRETAEIKLSAVFIEYLLKESDDVILSIENSVPNEKEKKK